MENNNFTPTPLIQSEKREQLDKKRSENYVLSFFCWFFTVLIWIYFIIILYLIFPFKDITWRKCETDFFDRIKCKDYWLKNEIKTKYIFILIPIYIIYLLLEFCSPSFAFLKNKIKDKGVYEQMKIFFKTIPTIIIGCSCYHSETETYTTTDSEGNSHTETRTVTVTTYSESLPFNYYSCRDVSGLFLLNTDNININKKAFIKLEIKEAINFADVVSYQDFIDIKEDMRRRNEHRDDCFSLYDTKKLTGIKRYYMVKLQDKKIRCVGPCWYVFFTLLSFGQFYKRYVSSLCIYQNFTIRKLISTRYDLGSDNCNDKYEKFNPQINIINQNLGYEPDSYIFTDKINMKPLPTESEILNAKKYECFIPKYEIYSENEVGRAGTIKETPGFVNFNDDQNNNTYTIREENCIEKQNTANQEIPLNVIKNDY